MALNISNLIAENFSIDIKGQFFQKQGEGDKSAQ